MSDDKFEFISGLCESKLIRHRNVLSKYNARDVADMIFLYFLALQVLKSDFNSAPFGLAYLKKSFIVMGTDNFNQNGTDLNVMVHTLFGRNNAKSYKELTDKEANDVLMKSLGFNYQFTKQWVQLSLKGQATMDHDRRFLLRLERDLKITNGDYRSMRRLIADWNRIDREAQQVAMTRLIHAFRGRMPDSELMRVLLHFARAKKLMLKGTKNPETGKYDPTLTSALISIAAGAVAGAGIYKLMRGNRHTYYKRKKAAMKETTGAGMIAAIPQPLADSKPKRRKKTKSDK